MDTGDMKKLTTKQKRFVEEYVLSYNASDAYLKAYGCSIEQAHRDAHKLLKKDYVLAYLHELQEEAVKQAGVSAAKYINKLDEMIANPKTSESGRLRAMEILNKMKGFNAPDKVEAKVEVVEIDVGFDE